MKKSVSSTMFSKWIVIAGLLTLSLSMIGAYALFDNLYYTNREIPYWCIGRNFQDSDMDTIPDCLEWKYRISVWDLFSPNMLNTDQDRYDDYQDIDSDNDCIRDYDEWWMSWQKTPYYIGKTSTWLKAGILTLIQQSWTKLSGDAVFLKWAMSKIVNGMVLGSNYLDNNVNNYTKTLLVNLYDSYEWQRILWILPHPKWLTLANHDGDAYPNLRDMDDDGDKILTLIENQWCISYDNSGNILWMSYHDVDGDSIPNFLDDDSDGDGILDKDEWWSHNTALLPTGVLDIDNDGIPNFLDADDNNDGVLTKNQRTIDTDRDGIPDYLDPDLKIDNAKDTDGDGIPDYIECPNTSACKDTDEDGIPNYKDTDSDNDTVPDSIEKWPNGRYPQDSDWDGIPDYRDTDDDNDVIWTKNEDSNKDGNPINDDSDRDGIPDYLDPDLKIDNAKDTDGDGIPDYIECPNTSAYRDTDGDGIPDYKDTDSDNDTVPDSIEKWPNGRYPQDSDGDGIPDYRDTDDDNDGIWTKNEDPNKDGNPTNDDSDGDGRPDYLDPDSPKKWWTWGGGWGWWWTWGGGWWSDMRWCMNPAGWIDVPHGMSITVYAQWIAYYPNNCTSGKKTCNNGSWLGSPYSFMSCNNVALTCLWPDKKLYYHSVIATFYKFNSVVWQQGDGDDICPRQTRQCIGGTRYTLSSIASNFTYQYKKCLVTAPD